MHCLLIVAVMMCAGGAFAAMCPGITLTDADRATAVNAHNSYRSQLAQGRTPARIGNAPVGRNIYKLQWDCTLEASAQAWANQCRFEHSARNNVGENLMLIGGTQTISSLLCGAADSWWSELAQFGMLDTSYTFTPAVFNSGVGHFTQMAWGNTKKLGCGVAKCGTSNIIVCHYAPAGNYLYEPIYQLGPACRQNSDCTTTVGSTCSVSEGLCVDPGYIAVPNGGGTPDTTNRCAGNEVEQPSRAYCLNSFCPTSYTCKFSAVAQNYVCCAPRASDPAADCSSADVLMYTTGNMPVYCPTLGNTGQCPSPYSFCVYSTSRQQNVCCRRSIGK